MPWILISLILLLIGFVIFSYWLYKKKKRPIDYYNLFLIGIVWIPIGIASKNITLWAMGLVLMIVGLVNKKKWKANRLRWKDLNKNEKRWRLIIMGILLVLVLITITFLLLQNYGII